MEKEKIKNDEALNLYDVFNENREIGKIVETTNKQKEEEKRKLLAYSNNYLSYQSDLAEVESVLGLKKNLEFFFCRLLPFVARERLIKDQEKLNHLDVNQYIVPIAFKLSFFKNENKSIYFYDTDSEYFLPSNRDDSNFDELLIDFVKQYHLGTINKLSSKPGELSYYFKIIIPLKDLIYICYLGEEWVNSLNDKCMDLLSDYYSKEQLENFQRTLHK